MGSICLSAAPILRCVSFDKLQNVALIIPTCLEVGFATSLVYFHWGSGRRHLLLTAEGWTYFLLALFELLSNVVPGIRDNLPAFRAFDMGIGIASFLPLFFYTFFLYLFTSGELTETLPNTIRKVAKISMILFVPAIVISNEVGSFVGGSVVQSTSAILQYAFNTKGDEWLWLFFTSLSLAVLVAFQATVFGFSTFRLVHTLVQRRRTTSTGQGRPIAFKGVGWVSAAAKLGALETIIGFAGGGFEVSLTRRILRLLARTCLYIGVVKGVDAVEDFDAIRSSYFQQSIEKSSGYRSKKRTGLRPLISNPRHSTFRELSPTAGSFHAALKLQDTPYDGSIPPRQPQGHYLTFTQRQRLSQLPSAGSPPGVDRPALAQFAGVKEKRNTQRVTVLYDLRDGAPSLHMRFSTLDIPSPALIVDKVKSRPTSAWMNDIEAYRRQDAMEDFESFRSSPQPRNTPSPYSRTSTLHDDTTSEEFLVPKPRFYADDGPRNQRRTSHFSQGSSGSKASTLPSPYEIVSASQMALSQRRAEAKLFLTRTPTPRGQRVLDQATPESTASSLRGGSPSPSVASTMFMRPAVNKPPYPPTIRIQSAVSTTSRRVSSLAGYPETSTSLIFPPSFSTDRDSSNLHHMSDSSISIQGVHALTSQFPRTPNVSRPPSFHLSVTPDPSTTTPGHPPLAAWNNGLADREGSPAFVARAYGSPSELMLAGGAPADVPGSRLSLAPGTVSWDDNRELPVTRAPAPAYKEEPLDPFAPTPPPSSHSPHPSSYDRTSQDTKGKPSFVPTAVALGTVQDLKNMWAHRSDESMSSGHDGERTPVTGFSCYTEFSSGVVDIPEGRTIGDVGAESLGTGKSGMFKRYTGSTASVSGAPTSPASVRLPTISSTSQGQDEAIRRRRSQSFNDKAKGAKVGSTTKPRRLSLVAESNGTELPSVDHDSQALRVNDLQNLHDRGKSIDQLAIHWGTSSTANRSKTSKQPPVQRVKSVGAVQSKITPQPNPPFARLRTESVHVHPIIIPPRAEDLPLAVQEASPVESRTKVPTHALTLSMEATADSVDLVGSLETAASFSGKGVLRDSEVLGIEDGLYVPYKPRPMQPVRKDGHYF